jgi:AcrR family transcriptional regulator
VTRERVIRVAQETIAEMGMSASIREIAERCGFTGNALYHYFPTKADLVEAIMTRNYEEFFGHLEVGARRGDCLVEDLLGVVDALEEFIGDRPWFPLVLVRTIPGVFRHNSPMPPAAIGLIDVLTDRAVQRGELLPSERSRLEGLVAVILMGLTLNGPNVRAAAYEGVRWTIEQLRNPSFATRTAERAAKRPGSSRMRGASVDGAVSPVDRQSSRSPSSRTTSDSRKAKI